MLGLIRKFGCLVVGATLLLATGGTLADNFPNKPVHILVTMQPVARSMCSRARSASRWPRPGASGP
jgi:hypothetical protein